MCWAFPQGEGPKVPSTTFERNLFLNPVIRITTVIMVFVDIKIASIVIGGRKVPKAEGLFISEFSSFVNLNLYDAIISHKPLTHHAS